ncbi:MAG: hypothetical protein EP344_12685 [Bacteroidetes bacterium]|nr:MAG: hypothetical protein EP344_12685 [Bacteroidota bacterium]
MIQEKTKELYDQALRWIHQRKFYGIKANVEPFDTPKTFHRQGDDLAITPDFTALRNEQKSFFDIVLKEDARRQIAGRWRLMQELAARNGGKLYLFAPKGHKAFAERLIGKYGLDARIIPLY